MAETLSIAVMAYNEGHTLESVVREILEEMIACDQGVEIVIVNDGSEDETEATADRLASEIPQVRAVHHPENQGLGEVYRTGFSEARGEWLTFMPGDGQIPASDLHGFLALMPESDMVLGYIPDRPIPLYVKALSFGERLLYRILFGAMPRFQGIVMVRTELLQESPLVSEGRGWTILMELILKTARGKYRLDQAQTGLRDRVAGESRVNNIQTIVSNLRQVIALRRTL